MASATFLSRILGLVREQAMAAVFGANALTDAFSVAYRVPNLLRDLFAEGAFSSAFVPVFSEAKKISMEEARKLLWSSFVLLGLLTGLISVLTIIFAPEVVKLFTDDKFIADPKRYLLTIQMVRIMAPFLVFVSLAALFMGVLNSLRIFFYPALAPAFFNIIMILSILFLPQWLETKGHNPIFSLAIGVIFGGLAQMLIQLPMLFKLSMGPTFSITLVSDYTKKILHRLGIGTIGVAGTQVNILINTILATGTVLGAVSWLNYAFRLFQFPIGILGVSIAGTNLVHFSDALKQDDHEEARNILSSSYTLALFFIIPAMALLMALKLPIVQLVFERGAFTSEDTSMVVLALQYYVLGLPFYGIVKIFGPVFFSLDKPSIPVKISLLSIGCNVIFCLSLVPIYGFKILALGTSVAMLVNSMAQSILLNKNLKLGVGFFINLRVLKFALIGLVTYGLTFYLVDKYYLTTESFWLRGSKFVGFSLIGGCTYLLLVLILGESKLLGKFLKKSKS